MASFLAGLTVRCAHYSRRLACPACASAGWPHPLPPLSPSWYYYLGPTHPPVLPRNSPAPQALGLPGLRIGWLATRDTALLDRVAELKDYTTICNSQPSEVGLKLGKSVRVGKIAVRVEGGLVEGWQI